MSLDLLQRGAAALGPLVEQVAFVGGASIVLWITDPGAPAPRPTKDIDVVVEVATRSELHAFEARLRAQGFRNDIDSDVICRWRHDERDLILDAMPAAGELLGFENPWQTAALPYAALRTLPSSTQIRAVTPPYLVATKLSAFAGRGGGDHLGSRDLEDIILLVDGREELVGEVAAADDEVRDFIAERVAGLLDQPRFVDAVFGLLRPDGASQARAESVVLPRLGTLAGR
jgi:Nucleotidyl transferase AbiEii toxin, Type IV TA system